MVESWTHDYIVADSIPGESCGRIFFSELNFSICSSPVFTAIAFKRPGCSAKSAGGRLVTHSYILDPTQLELAVCAAQA